MIAPNPRRQGQPCLAGTRLSVADVLRYAAGGMTAAQIADDFPGVAPEDVAEALRYAAGVLEGVRSEEATGGFEHAALSVVLAWHRRTSGREDEATARLRKAWPDFASALARLAQLCEARRPRAFEEAIERLSKGRPTRPNRP